jgi:hypothetical protein
MGNPGNMQIELNVDLSQDWDILGILGFFREIDRHSHYYSDHLDELHERLILKGDISEFFYKRDVISRAMGLYIKTVPVGIVKAPILKQEGSFEDMSEAISAHMQDVFEHERPGIEALFDIFKSEFDTDEVPLLTFEAEIHIFSPKSRQWVPSGIKAQRTLTITSPYNNDAEYGEDEYVGSKIQFDNDNLDHLALALFLTQDSYQFSKVSFE